MSNELNNLLDNIIVVDVYQVGCDFTFWSQSLVSTTD